MNTTDIILIVTWFLLGWTWVMIFFNWRRNNQARTFATRNFTCLQFDCTNKAQAYYGRGPAGPGYYCKEHLPAPKMPRKQLNRDLDDILKKHSEEGNT